MFCSIPVYCLGLIYALSANQQAETRFSMSTVLLGGFRFYETVIKSNGRESYRCSIHSQFSQNGQTLKYDMQLNIPNSESFLLTRYVVKCIFVGVVCKITPLQFQRDKNLIKFACVSGPVMVLIIKITIPRLWLV